MATKQRFKRLRYICEDVAYETEGLITTDLNIYLCHLRWGHWDTGEDCHSGDQVWKRTGYHPNTVDNARARLVEAEWLHPTRPGGVEGGGRATVYRWQIPPEVAASSPIVEEQRRLAVAETLTTLRRLGPEETQRLIGSTADPHDWLNGLRPAQAFRAWYLVSEAAKGQR